MLLNCRDRRGADHARDHPDRGPAAAAGADRHCADGAVAGGQPDRLAARTRRAGGRRHSRRAAASAGEISGELDVRRDDRLRRAARHRPDRGRPAALDARRGAGRHRRRDRHALCADQQVDARQPHQCRAGLVCGRHRHLRHFRHGDRAGHQRALRRRRGGVRAGRDGRHAGAGAHAAYRSDFRRRPSSVALRVRLDHDAGDRASVRTAAGGCGRLRPRSLRVFVGWAKRSVPTILEAIGDRWWARREAPLPTLRSYARFADTMPHTAITAIASEISTL